MRYQLPVSERSVILNVDDVCRNCSKRGPVIERFSIECRNTISILVSDNKANDYCVLYSYQSLTYLKARM